MPYIQSDFDKANLRFGGPSKFISQKLKFSREKDPYELIGLAHSMFVSLGELGLLTYDFNDRYAVGESGETDFAPRGASAAYPLLASTAKEAATALALASVKDNPVDAIRATEHYLDAVAAIGKTKTGKRKKNPKSPDDKGSWITALACLDGQLKSPSSLDLRKYDDIFDTFANQLGSTTYDRRRSLCHGGYNEHYDYFGDSAERALKSILKYL